MKALLVTGLVFLASFGVQASTFKVKSAECLVQRDVNDHNTFDTFVFTKDASGKLSAQLPEGVVATLESVDSGFNVFYHTVTVELGDLAVSNTGSTSKILSAKGPIDSTIVRTEGTIVGRRFICDATILPVR